MQMVVQRNLIDLMWRPDRPEQACLRSFSFKLGQRLFTCGSNCWQIISQFILLQMLIAGRHAVELNQFLRLLHVGATGLNKNDMALVIGSCCIYNCLLLQRCMYGCSWTITNACHFLEWYVALQLYLRSRKKRKHPKVRCKRPAHPSEQRIICTRALAWALRIASGHAARTRDTSTISLQPLGRTPALQVITGLHNS